MFLYLVRHGQSQNNAGASVLDPLLTEKGHEQARRAGKALIRKDVRDRLTLPVPTVVVASPMRRALQTARHVADAIGIENVLVRHDTHECTGPQDGRLVRDTIATEFPKTVIDDDMPDGAWWPAVKEDANASEQRARKVLIWLREKYGGTDAVVALVTHGAFGGFFLGTLLGNPFGRMVQMTQFNCAISLFDLDAQADIGKVTRCWFVNETTHVWPDLIT